MLNHFLNQIGNSQLMLAQLAWHKSAALTPYLVSKHQSLTLKVAEVLSMHANVCQYVKDSSSNADFKTSNASYPRMFSHSL